MKKKKILFVNNTMGRAGAEMALIELLKALQKTGEYDISLYVMLPRGELFARVPKGVKILNRHPSCGSVHSRAGRVFLARRTIRAFFTKGCGFSMLGELFHNARDQKKRTGRIQLDKLLWRLLANGAPYLSREYDLAVAYLEGASAYFLADHVKAKKKAAFIHIDYQKAGYTRQMDQGCYDDVDRIFTVSKEVGERFCEVYPEYKEKVELFHNLLDVKRIRRLSKETGFTDSFDGIRLVTVGRLHPQKAYDIAIEACAKVRQDGYPIRWYVLGEGSERKRLEAQIHSLGLNKDFILMGAKDNPYPYIREADIYVHATHFEGKSIAIEEAQILGKVILASDCTGNREQIRSGTDGLLFPLSVENLVENLERLLDDKELQERFARETRNKTWEFKEELLKLQTLLE
jgi:glycosyltransferase involved in cell wall biosynthesis